MTGSTTPGRSTTPRRVANVALWVIVAGSIAAALYLAALERLLLGTAVIFVVGVPAAALLVVTERRGPTRSAAQRLVTARTMSVAFTVIGASAMLVGVVLWLTLHDAVGHLPGALFWMGAPVLTAGVSAGQQVRARADGPAPHV